MTLPDRLQVLRLSSLTAVAGSELYDLPTVPRRLRLELG